MAERETGLYYALQWAGVYDLSQYLVRSWSSRHDFVSRHIRPHAGQQILDLGCGTGSILNHFPEIDYVGIDANCRYIRTARRRFGDKGCFRIGDVSDLHGLPAAGFDLVVALGVMHHLGDDLVTRMLDGVKRVLRDGGRFVSHDPVLVDSQSRLSRWMVCFDRGEHVRCDAELIALVQPHFSAMTSVVTHSSLRIPFSEIILDCQIGQRTFDGTAPLHS